MTSFLTPIQERLKILGRIPAWFWQDILFPFFLVRLVLVVCAWFAPYFLPNPTYQTYVTRGYFLTPNFWIDMWCRWDSGWYLSVITRGYSVPPGFPSVTSNLPFFPLYPCLVKIITALLPSALQKTSVELLLGLLLSNAACLAALTLLYKLVQEYLFDSAAARRSVILLLVFPTSFYLTSFYAEGLFLCLVLCAFYAGLKNRWVAAGLLAGLIAITRFQGILVVFALAWLYMENRAWDFRRIRPDLLAMAAAPLALLAYACELYLLTGRPLALVDAEKAWAKSLPTSLADFSSVLAGRYTQMDVVDLVAFLLLVVLTLLVLYRFHNKAYGVFCLGSLALPLASLQIFSMTRYVACVFPVFIVLGYYAKNRYFYYFLLLTSFALLVLFWVGWQNYYWID